MVNEAEPFEVKEVTSVLQRLSLSREEHESSVWSKVFFLRGARHLTLKVASWCSTLTLFINIDKSNLFIFLPIQRKLLKQAMVCINNQMLTEETSIRYLGVYIDYNVS